MLPPPLAQRPVPFLTGLPDVKPLGPFTMHHFLPFHFLKINGSLFALPK